MHTGELLSFQVRKQATYTTRGKLTMHVKHDFLAKDARSKVVLRERESARTEGEGVKTGVHQRSQSGYHE
jgi:hypothetical protein